MWAKYIRKIMDMNNWNAHLLVHVHEKFGYSDAAVLEVCFPVTDVKLKPNGFNASSNIFPETASTLQWQSTVVYSVEPVLTSHMVAH